MQRLVAVIVLVLGIGLSGCAEVPTRGECQRLIDHLIDLQIAAAKGKPEHKQQIFDQIGGQLLKNCEKTLAMTQVQCGLAAQTSADLAACDVD